MSNKIWLVILLLMVGLGAASAACYNVVGDNTQYVVRPDECYIVSGNNVTILGGWKLVNIVQNLASGEVYSNSTLAISVSCANLTKENRNLVLSGGECYNRNDLNFSVCASSSNLTNLTQTILASMNYTQLCSSVNLSCTDCGALVADCNNNLTSLVTNSSECRGLYEGLNDTYRSLKNKCDVWELEGSPDSIRAEEQRTCGDTTIGVVLVAAAIIGGMVYYFVYKKPSIVRKEEE